MPPAEEITQQFFEAIERGIRAMQNGTPSDDWPEGAVGVVFGILDGVAGYSGLPPFDVTCQDKAIAPGDYIHEAWGKYLRDRRLTGDTYENVIISGHVEPPHAADFRLSVPLNVWRSLTNRE